MAIVDKATVKCNSIPVRYDAFIMVYYIGCLSVGLLCFSVVTIAVLAFRDDFTRRFFLFYSTFSLFTGSTVALTGIPKGMLDISAAAFGFLVYASIFANGLFMAALPDYTDYLKGYRSTKRRLLWLSVGALVVAVLFVFTKVDTIGKNLSQAPAAGVALRGIFLAVILYSFWGAQRSIRERPDKLESRFIRRFEIASLCFLPGVIIDVTLAEIIGFRFFPLLYAVISIVFTSFILQFIRIALAEKASRPLAIPEAYLVEKSISPREREVMVLIVRGLNNSEIADKLCVSISTVKTHVQSIFRKTGVGGRFELVRFIGSAPPPAPQQR